MIITYYGKQGFRLQQGQTVLGINHSGGRTNGTRFKCDVLLAGLMHSDFISEGIDIMTGGDNGPFVVAGPGEYEIKDVVIKGYVTPANYQGHTINTLYMIQWEGLRLCAVGALSEADRLSPEAKEAISETDILFIPIGGGEVLGAEEAYKLAVKIEPGLIIPCHYNSNGDLEHFLKEGGMESVTPEDKLTVKKRDVEGKTGEIRVLKPQ